MLSVGQKREAVIPKEKVNKSISQRAAFRTCLVVFRIFHPIQKKEVSFLRSFFGRKYFLVSLKAGKKMSSSSQKRHATFLDCQTWSLYHVRRPNIRSFSNQISPFRALFHALRLKGQTEVEILAKRWLWVKTPVPRWTPKKPFKKTTSWGGFPNPKKVP